MKKLLAVLVSIMIFTPVITFADNKDSLSDKVILEVGQQNALVNGEIEKVCCDSEAAFPFIMNERTFIPLRSVSEIFGAEVSWDDKTKTATVQQGRKTAKIKLGEKSITIDGTPEPIEASGVVIYGKFFLPLRVVAERILEKNVYFVSLKEKKARMIIISSSVIDKASLNTAALSGSSKIRASVDSSENGLSKDNKYYYIKGRAYVVSGFAEKKADEHCTVAECPLYNKPVRIPLITVNWLLITDPDIYKVVYDDYFSLLKELIFEVPQKKYLYLRKEIADEIKMVINTIVDQGYPIKVMGAFRLNSTDFVSAASAAKSGREQGNMWARFHPNGLAIDFNWEENPILYSSSKNYAAEIEKRKNMDDPNSIVIHFNDHVVVKTFEAHGWRWGIWSSTTDYMHFSMGE